MAYRTPGLAGLHAAIRAGLGIGALPSDMLPPGPRILGEREGLPARADAEAILCRAALSGDGREAEERLSRYILHALQGAPVVGGEPA